MRQKLNLIQTLSQRLSPQQIQFIKLLQVPTAELAARIEEELESNPALEEGKAEEEKIANLEEYDDHKDDNAASFDEVNFSDYVSDDDISGYKMQGDGPNNTEEERIIPIASTNSLVETLEHQLNYLKLSEKEQKIGKQIIGNIDDDGYMKRDIQAIINDLAFSQNLTVSTREIKDILKHIQSLDPPGIAAGSLQECLELQLKRKRTGVQKYLNARKIIILCFQEFIKKHYTKIQKKLGLNHQEIKSAMDVILTLNPKPGGGGIDDPGAQYLTPDFMLKKIEGKLEVTLNARNAPELHVSKSYADMIDTYEKTKNRDKKLRQTALFVKQKLDAAKWFIDAIKQRQNTLLRTMRTIVQLQYDFFVTGEESKLRPMILKDVAEKINMDISTVSRVANSKSVQTNFGLFSLKFFFSEGIATDSGQEVSSKKVKYVLRTIIENEDESKPLSDDKLEKLLRMKGYNIARRTVAKYREQLNIPVARLRKKL